MDQLIDPVDHAMSKVQLNEPYEYEILEEDTNHIRVLKLREDKELTCEIQHISLDPKLLTVPEYTALSYEWGTCGKTSKMAVVGKDGKSLGFIDITQSLHDSLSDIRDSAISPKVVFADQVCIQQSDKTELNHQVAQMGRVYHRAAQVVTYLGPKQEEDDAGFEIVDTIFNYFEPKWDQVLDLYEKERNAPFHEKNDNLSLDFEEDLPGWNTIGKLMYGGWCKRLWMCSENMVNRKTMFLRGTHIFEWRAIVGLHLLAQLTLIGPRSIFKSLALGQAYSSAMAIWRSRDESDEPTLLNNLWCFGSTDCSDPRDKIYGLLSISNDAKKLNIQPDYSPTKTDHDVYLETTVALCRLYSLRFLVMTEAYASTRPGWESWLPDWTSPRYAVSIEPWRAKALARHKPWWDLRSPRKFSVSFMYEESIGRTACVCSGIIIDKIETTLDIKLVHPIISISDEISNARFKDFESTVEFARHRNFSDDIIGTCFTHGRHTKNPDVHEVGRGLALQAFMKNMRRELSPNSKSLAAFGLTNASYTLALAFERIVKASRFESLFVTDSNHLGIGHVNVQPGDVLARLNGAAFLSILRPRDDGHYMFVGRAYRHAFNKSQICGPYAIREISLV